MASSAGSAPRFHNAVERLAANKFEHHIQLVALTKHRVKRRDIGVIELGERNRLGAKAFDDGILACQLGTQCFYGDFAVEHRIDTLINRTHAAFAELFFDLVIAYYLSDHPIN